MRILGLIFAVFFVACGGQVDDGGEKDPTGAPGSPSGDSGTDEDDPWSGVPLGDCQGGFKPGNPEEPCVWKVGKLCYPTKHDACNCACPKDHDSICSSGYPDGFGPVEVFCL
jgi:hypothetical protein